MSEPTAIAGVFAHWGEAIIAGLLAVIGWVLKATAGRHFESMDKINEKLSTLGGELRDAKGQLVFINSKLEATDGRLDKLEHHMEKVDLRIDKLMEDK